MKSRVSFVQTLSACTVACLLVACGSDDNKPDTQPNPSPTPPAIDGYVGQWQSGCYGSGMDAYGQEELVISRYGDGDLLSQAQLWFFTDAECTQKIGPMEEGESVMTLIGKKDIRLDGQGQVEADVFQSVHKNPDDPEHPKLLWDVFYRKDNMLWWCNAVHYDAGCNVDDDFLPLHKE